MQRVAILQNHKFAGLETQVTELTALKPSIKSNTEGVGRLRVYFDDLDAASDHLKKDVDELKKDLTKAEKDSTWATDEVFKLNEELKRYKDERRLLTSAMHGRLSSLEELRRMDMETRGMMNSSEINAYKIEGFQMCVMMMAARGYFPELLLNDPSFINMVSDRNALLMAIAQNKNAHRGYQGPPRDHLEGRDGPGASRQRR